MAYDKQPEVTQLDIWSLLDATALEPINRPDYGEEESLEERFERFHAANPHIYKALKEMALALKVAGLKRYGIDALFGFLRFNHSIRTQGDGFKLNNDFKAFYSRMLMEEEEELTGFFEVRSTRRRPPPKRKLMGKPDLAAWERMAA